MQKKKKILQLSALKQAELYRNERNGQKKKKNMTAIFVEIKSTEPFIMLKDQTLHAVSNSNKYDQTHILETYHKTYLLVVTAW